ncbi:MAG: IS1380 family transposase [Rubrobacteraceae bacterium]
MDDCATTRMRFETETALALEAAFDGGAITSDGGLPFLARMDSELGVCRTLAACVPEWRSGPVKHSLLDLVRQRVFQIACGYEDQNDADFLRGDPLLKLACGRLPQTGEDLASQPTLSRLENAPDARGCYRMAEALVQLYIRRRGRDGAPERVLLDFDSTDDPAHGEQEGVRYHGYFGQHQYHPLLVFDGDTGQILTALLRPGNAHAGAGALSILKRIVERLREKWPQTRVEIRADAGFALPAVYEWCEQQGIFYTIGLVSNPRLEELAAPLAFLATMASMVRMRYGVAPKVKLLSEAPYEAGSWGKKRRIIYKAEALRKGTNTRFVVTNRIEESPTDLYDGHYVIRGETENRIKDYKRALRAERLSCCAFLANQFRLLLHAAAYWLLDTLRERLASESSVRMQLDTLRLRLIKIGGRVRQLVGKVRLYLASGHPGQRLWQALCSMAEPARE